MQPFYDIFCGAGGCTHGYKLAGIPYIVGVDLHNQPRYCGDEFIQMDALDFLKRYLHGEFPEAYGFHASPPCQGYSSTKDLHGKTYPLLIEPIRELLKQTGKPYIIEGVKRSPLKPTVTLTGNIFNLMTIRQRLFECSFYVPYPFGSPPSAKQCDLGRSPKPGEYIHVVGHFSNMAYAKSAMGIDWMNQEELAEAIPPAYTEYIGKYFLDANQT